MKIESINLNKLRTNANQLKHYNRQIKTYDYCLIIYDYKDHKEFYLKEEEIFNYNGVKDKKNRYKKEVYNFKNYMDGNYNLYRFENYVLVYSKYFKKYTSKEEFQNYQKLIIKNIERTFKSEIERNFFINNVQYLEEDIEGLFIEYLKELKLLKDSKKRFHRILKSIKNKTMFFNINKKDIKKASLQTKQEKIAVSGLNENVGIVF